MPEVSSQHLPGMSRRARWSSARLAGRRAPRIFVASPCMEIGVFSSSSSFGCFLYVPLYGVFTSAVKGSDLLSPGTSSVP